LNLLEAYAHLSTSSGWQTLPARIIDKKITLDIPSVRQPLTYYFSAKNAFSNRGGITPLDPPAIAQGRITVTPPPYTERPVTVVPAIQPFMAPEGSLITVEATATATLQAATFTYGNLQQAPRIEGDRLTAAFAATRSEPFSFSLKDQHELTGESHKYNLTVIPDVSPSIEIISPKPIDEIPSLMLLNVQAHIKDDYRIEKIFAHYRLNNKENTARTDLLWAYSQEEAKRIGSSTDFYISYQWDLSKLGLFPGDELSLTLEAWDNDALHGPKWGRSDPHILKYSSLVDLLETLDKKEQDQVRDMSGVVDEQHKINEEAKKTLDQVSQKRDSSAPDQEGKESTWSEKKNLEDLKKRQEKLVEEAKKIEQDLASYQKNTEQNLPEKDRKQQGFTPETLEKMQRIRSLMEELVDKDSRELIQKIENTINEMAKQIPDEKLEDLKSSFSEFEKNLDRTLSMLESTYQARQLEGLRQMADDLAQRQDHLQRETRQFIEEKNQAATANPASASSTIQSSTAGSAGKEGTPSPQDKQTEQQKNLEAKEDLLGERQKRIEQDTQRMMEKMLQLQQAMKSQNPELAQRLQQLQQQMTEQRLQQEVNEAAKKLNERKPQQAVPHQQTAQSQFQSLSQQLDSELGNMGSMNLKQDTSVITRLIDRGLFLSHQIQTLTEPAGDRRDPQWDLRYAQAYLRELKRIEVAWDTIAKTNPFLSRQAATRLRQSRERLQHAMNAGQGVQWVGYEESRQSLTALNEALYRMLTDMQNMQQMMNQSSMQGMQKQMQQMISRQQELNQMLEQLRQMGENGQKMLEQLQGMAKQQAQIRKEIEKMMEQYRHAEQLKNRLNGIYQEMQEVEKRLNQGQNDEQVKEKQKRILTRMLDAGTMQKKDQYGEQRKEAVAKTGFEGGNPSDSFPLTLKEKVQRAAERPPEEKIPPQYREAIKNYYTRLAERMGK